MHLTTRVQAALISVRAALGFSPSPREAPDHGHSYASGQPHPPSFDPRVGMVTVSAVEVTRDLSHATVRVVPHGEPAEREAAVEGLQRAAGFLRGFVATALTTRITPELHFVLDRGFEHALEIDRLLAGLKREEEAS